MRSQDGNGQSDPRGISFRVKTRRPIAGAYLCPVRDGWGALFLGYPYAPDFFWFLSSQIVAYLQGPGSPNVAAHFGHIAAAGWGFSPGLVAMKPQAGGEAPTAILPPPGR